MESKKQKQLFFFLSDQKQIFLCIQKILNIIQFKMNPIGLKTKRNKCKKKLKSKSSKNYNIKKN